MIAVLCANSVGAVVTDTVVIFINKIAAYVMIAVLRANSVGAVVADTVVIIIDKIAV